LPGIRSVDRYREWARMGRRHPRVSSAWLRRDLGHRSISAEGLSANPSNSGKTAELFRGILRIAGGSECASPVATQVEAQGDSSSLAGNMSAVMPGSPGPSARN